MALFAVNVVWLYAAGQWRRDRSQHQTNVNMDRRIQPYVTILADAAILTAI